MWGRLGCENSDIGPITCLLAPGTPENTKSTTIIDLTEPSLPDVEMSLSILLNSSWFWTRLSYSSSAVQTSVSQPATIRLNNTASVQSDWSNPAKRSSGFEQLQQLTASLRDSIAGYYIFPFIGFASPSVVRWLPNAPLCFSVLIQGSFVLSTCLSGGRYVLLYRTHVSPIVSDLVTRCDLSRCTSKRV